MSTPHLSSDKKDKRYKLNSIKIYLRACFDMLFARANILRLIGAGSTFGKTDFHGETKIIIKNMLSNFAKNRVAVFIDASNIYYSQKKLKWQIDFKKFFEYLKNEVDLREIYYYTARDFNFAKQTKFISFLEKTGYKVRSKKVKFIKNRNKELEKDGFNKGNLDVELTIDVLEDKDKYDTMILISGDSDFEPLLKLMKRKYKKNA